MNWIKCICENCDEEVWTNEPCLCSKCLLIEESKNNNHNPKLNYKDTSSKQSLGESEIRNNLPQVEGNEATSVSLAGEKDASLLSNKRFCLSDKIIYKDLDGFEDEFIYKKHIKKFIRLLKQEIKAGKPKNQEMMISVSLVLSIIDDYAGDNLI